MRALFMPYIYPLRDYIGCLISSLPTKNQGVEGSRVSETCRVLSSVPTSEAAGFLPAELDTFLAKAYGWKGFRV